MHPARIGLILSIASLVLAGSTAARSSRTITVCPVGPPACDFATVQAALNAAARGDTIHIAGGVYAGGFVIGKDVSLVGSGAAATTITSFSALASPRVQVARNTSVSISDLAITGGTWSPILGGAIHNEGDLVLDRVRVYGNRVNGYGVGGIYSSGHLTLNRSEVTMNVGGWAGGILNASGELTLRRSAVTGNRGSSQGGGLENRGTAAISDSTISDNLTDLGAAGIDNSGSLSLVNSAVERNSNSDGFGGGLANRGTATITGTEVSDNTGGVGGGIANSSTGVLTLRRSLVAQNKTNQAFAGADGGGISNWGAALILDTTIAGNRGVDNLHHYWSGGGLANHGTAWLYRVTITENDAEAQGGGVMNDGTLMLDQSRLTRNVAQGLDGQGVFGGGVYNLGILQLSRTTISGNRPDNCVGCSPFRQASPSLSVR